MGAEGGNPILSQESDITGTSTFQNTEHAGHPNSPNLMCFFDAAIWILTVAIPILTGVSRRRGHLDPYGGASTLSGRDVT